MRGALDFSVVIPADAGIQFGGRAKLDPGFRRDDDVVVRVVRGLRRGGAVARVGGGFRFRAVDVLMANFRLPRSTLLRGALDFSAVIPADAGIQFAGGAELDPGFRRDDVVVGLDSGFRRDDAVACDSVQRQADGSSA